MHGFQKGLLWEQLDYVWLWEVELFDGSEELLKCVEGLKGGLNGGTKVQSRVLSSSWWLKTIVFSYETN